MGIGGNIGQGWRQVLWLTIANALGCSHATRIAAGPAATFIGDGQASPGAEAVARMAAGTSDERSSTVVEASGRLQANERTQLLEAGLGPAWFGSFAREFMMLSAAGLFGAERRDARLLALGSLHAAVGAGVRLRTSSEVHSGEFMPDVVPAAAPEIWRESTALTLELGASLDAPLTRSPQFSLCVLIGIVWLDERYPTEAPREPAQVPLFLHR